LAKLTKSYIDRLPLPRKTEGGAPSQAIYRDSALPGFGLLVGSGGTKSFFVERRVNGRVKRMSIGRYGHLTPTQARIKAQEMLGTIALGKDPGAEKRASKARVITLGAAFEDYLRTRKDLKLGTIGNYRKCMDGCVPDWLHKRLVDIDKDMVQRRHSDIGRTAPARANNTMRVLRAVYNHAMQMYEDEQGRQIIASNPVDRLSRSRAWYRVERRKTLLTPNELPRFFEATADLTHAVTQDYLTFLLFTGLRKMEAATIQWSQVNLNDRTFTIEDTKNRIPHTLPMSEFIFHLLETRHKESQSLWVFPSPITGSHIKEPRGALRHIAEKLGKPLTFHDLRRTFITIAEGLDIPAYALKRLLNHTNSNDVTSGYIVIDTNRLRNPMEKISEFILEAGKIVR